MGSLTRYVRLSLYGVAIALPVAALAHYVTSGRLSSADVATMIGSAIGAAATVAAVVIATHHASYRERKQIRAYILASMDEVADAVRRLRGQLRSDLFAEYGIGRDLPPESWVVIRMANENLRGAIARAEPRIRRLQEHAHKLDWVSVDLFHRLEDLMPELRALTDKVAETDTTAIRMYGGEVPDEIYTPVTRAHAELKALLRTLSEQ